MADDAAWNALNEYTEALENLSRLMKDRRAASGQADDGSPLIVSESDAEIIEAVRREQETYAAWEVERKRVFGSAS